MEKLALQRLPSSGSPGSAASGGRPGCADFSTDVFSTAPFAGGRFATKGARDVGTALAVVLGARVDPSAGASAATTFHATFVTTDAGRAPPRAPGFPGGLHGAPVSPPGLRDGAAAASGG